MNTTPQQRLACFGEIDKIIAGYRSAVRFSGDDGLGPVFDECERLVAEGRRADLALMKASKPAPGSNVHHAAAGGSLPGRSVTFTQPPAKVTMTAERRHELLSMTPLGRSVLLHEAQQRPDEVTFSGMDPAERRRLLAMTGIGAAILRDEDKVRWERGA
jgi:hypothetical protein